MFFLKSPISVALIIIFLLQVEYVKGQKQIVQPPVQKEWVKDYKPFQICGNLYYVGTSELACYLITTPNGHILINTGVAESAPMIKSHIEALGFRFSDIKILLTSQVHYDHVGAMAEIKKLTGAKLIVNERDASVLEDGGYSDYLFGGKNLLFKPVKVDRLLGSKDTIMLGGETIIAIHLPGHTKGSTGFLFNEKANGKTYRIFIANMPTVLEEARFPSMKTYPTIERDFDYTFKVMKKIKFELWLAAHCSQFSLHTKHKESDGYNPEQFRDQMGYDQMLENLYKQYLNKKTTLLIKLS